MFGNVLLVVSLDYMLYVNNTVFVLCVTGRVSGYSQLFDPSFFEVDNFLIPLPHPEISQPPYQTLYEHSLRTFEKLIKIYRVGRVNRVGLRPYYTSQ